MEYVRTQQGAREVTDAVLGGLPAVCVPQALEDHQIQLAAQQGDPSMVGTVFYIAVYQRDLHRCGGAIFDHRLDGFECQRNERFAFLRVRRSWQGGSGEQGYGETCKAGDGRHTSSVFQSLRKIMPGTTLICRRGRYFTSETTMNCGASARPMKPPMTVWTVAPPMSSATKPSRSGIAKASI